jgi:hypothetical protein
MKSLIQLSLLTALLAILPFWSTPLQAQNQEEAAKKELIEKLKKDYPLETCVISGDKLGGMEKPVEYLHEESGKPTRLVRFCCRGCVKSFKKEPAKYLKILDEGFLKKKSSAS